ncbi:MAG: lamin tail domain-containing protein [Candidatus Latescibacteria bacterium]|nr:lamin tail domain-containing protein [Candidatus Latescibacterota bacterium]
MTFPLQKVKPRTLCRALIALVFLGFGAVSLRAEGVRNATYNIKFLSVRHSPCGRLPVEDVRTQGKRLDKLREVIRLLDAQVIGLEEIDDRAALEELFDPQQWTLIIDDDSQDCQDLALAVRRPLKVRGFTPPDFDADDAHFLAADEEDEFFPRRRDLLAVEVQTAAGHRFWVLVHHAKSRAEGRADSDERRAGAGARIVALIRERLAGQPLVLVGDFNDSPDDRALNILETGDPQAEARIEDEPGPFLDNLTEPLFAAERVSFGRNSGNLDGDRVATVAPGTRQRNFELRHTNMNTGDLLFDQILVSPALAPAYVKGSARVFDYPVAVRGNDRDRASDHLPVYADFVFGNGPAKDEQALTTTPAASIPRPTPPTPPSVPALSVPAPPPLQAPVHPVVEGAGGLRIAGLLPDPEGEDEGHEQVVLENRAAAAVNLKGWKLRDHSGNEYALKGKIAGGEQLVLTLPAGALPLNNAGDEVVLIAPGGKENAPVRYKSGQVKAGRMIPFR